MLIKRRQGFPSVGGGPSSGMHQQADSFMSPPLENISKDGRYARLKPVSSSRS